MANLSVSQLQQMLELIGKLREEVDKIKADSLKWKENMDRLAVERETARAQLSSIESQLQSLKEKSLDQAREKEELEARLASELAKAEKIKADADAMVAVYWDDAEDAQFNAREARELEAEAGALASDDDDDEYGDDDDDEYGDDVDNDRSKNGSQSREEPDVEKTAPVDD
ncbi:histone chaperone asf1-like [Nicotiana tomentosiformis]|uniref:histone chaperone asf1-like n=1 Tax=Nicotiana tomentosiformis TaxID=4098 RepID=UPI00388C4A96